MPMANLYAKDCTSVCLSAAGFHHLTADSLSRGRFGSLWRRLCRFLSFLRCFLFSSGRFLSCGWFLPSVMADGPFRSWFLPSCG